MGDQEGIYIIGFVLVFLVDGPRLLLIMNKQNLVKYC